MAEIFKIYIESSNIYRPKLMKLLDKTSFLEPVDDEINAHYIASIQRSLDLESFLNVAENQRQKILVVLNPLDNNARAELTERNIDVIIPSDSSIRSIFQRLVGHLTLLTKQPAHKGIFWGRSPESEGMFKEIDVYSKYRYPVLITGEPGTGKELVAKILAGENDFFPINCAEIPDNLFESVMFGHRKGSFTGADSDKKGIVFMAGIGTVFMDEIGLLQIRSQGKLLRVLEQMTALPLGAGKEGEVKSKFIFATNKNLDDECKKGKFMPDLFDRFKEFKIEIPPLRSRKSDIPIISQYFIKSFNFENSRKLNLSSQVVDYLYRYDWPGNVRELKNVIRKAAMFSGENGNIDGRIVLKHIQEKGSTNDTPNQTSSFHVEFNPHEDEWQDVSKRAWFKYSDSLLKITRNNAKEASQMAGVSLSQFYNKRKAK